MPKVEENANVMEVACDASNRNVPHLLDLVVIVLHMVEDYAKLKTAPLELDLVDYVSCINECFKYANDD